MRPDDWGSRLNGAGRDGFPYVRRIGGLALIGLNSAVPTKPFVAAGRLGSISSQPLVPCSTSRARRASSGSS